MASSGEGSRGGKIIGHTKGGYPIYATSDRQKHDYDKHKRIVKGVSYIGAGVATSSVVGAASGSILRKSADIENLAHKAAGIADKGINAARKAKIHKFVIKTNLLKMALEHGHDFGRAAASAAGTALIYKGVTTAVDDKHKDTLAKKASIGAGAAVVADFTTRVFENRELSHSLGASVKTAVSKIGKAIAKPKALKFLLRRR